MQLNVSRYADTGEAKAAALVAIDTAAGEARQRFITTVPGQAETYAEKLKDAQAYIDAGYPADAASYPWVQAKADASSLTPTQAADMIVEAYEYWVGIGVQIEQARETGKSEARAATTLSAVAQARHSAIAALEGI